MTLRRLLFRLIIATAICGAAYLIYRALSRYTMDDIVDSVSSIPSARLIGALTFATASYLCLTGFDALAVRYAGKPLPYRRTALASFVSLSIGHNIGIAALSSGAIRYRFYSRWGLSVGDVAKVILFSGVTVGLGLVTLGGLGLMLYPGEAQSIVGLRQSAVMGIAITCIACPIIYLGLSSWVRKPLSFRNWTLELPTLRLACGQVGIGTLNFACVAACLYQLLAAFTEDGYLKVAAVYVIANLTALVSHVPGGLGVLEATILFLLSGTASIGALVAFRVVYFFVPLAIGLPLFLVSEHVLRNTKEPSAKPAEQSR